MSFLQTTSLYKLFYPILILSFFLISTCTNDNSITANNNETSLSKPIDISDITSTNPIFPPALIALIEEHIGFFSTAEVRCLGEWIESTGSQTNIQSAYDFRDNYLLNSEKGQLYTASYYFL
ncbi:hypothetical protein KKF86_04665, partial [bacterium]|nr:hypothetical protein [bacterium]